jgi:hypothetical protein
MSMVVDSLSSGISTTVIGNYVNVTNTNVQPYIDGGYIADGYFINDVVKTEINVTLAGLIGLLNIGNVSLPGKVVMMDVTSKTHLLIGRVRNYNASAQKPRNYTAVANVPNRTAM